MIVYFANRQLHILGQASTELPKGLIIADDLKTEDIESGVAVFECTIPFDDETRQLVESCTRVGNYILRSYDNANEFYTIIDAEVDTKKQEATIYAEDAGLDLLNEIVESYEAEEDQPIDFYIEKFAYDSGFEIGINEASGLTRKLSWNGESTAAERIANVAKEFDGCEISYSFEIKGLEITHKYINIFKERGKDIGANLRLNEDIDRIVTKTSIANLATALKCSGGTPDQTTDILEQVSSDAGTPKVLYSVSLETLSRTATSVNISASVSAALNGEDDVLGKGYILNASIYMGGSWHQATIKDKDTEWKGTTGHSTDFSFTVSGLTAAAKTYTDIKFAVARGDKLGGSAGVLAEKACGQYVVTNYIEGGVNGEGISERPMTLEGYKYDDGNFYIDGTYLKSREALKEWSRYSWTKEPNQTKAGGHIARPFSYDTLSQEELLAHALTELEKACVMEVNYEIDITRLPENIKIGDRINIIDDAGELYVSARVLKLEVSVADQNQKATLGEYMIKTSGISQMVEELAAQFAADASINKAARLAALRAAQQAEAEAEAAKEVATEAGTGAANATAAAQEAKGTAEAAKADAGNAAKSATDFISKDETNGVQLGNKENGGFVGYRTQIKNDSFNILDANGKAVASYGANTVDIGKNNQNTEISFCGGKAKLKYDAGTDVYRLSAEAVSLHSRNIIKNSSGVDMEYSNNVAAGKDHVRIMASRYQVDADGTSVGDINDSWVTVDGDKVTVGSDSVVHLQAPQIISDGNFFASGLAELQGGLDVGGSIHDMFGALIGNGLAAYTGGGDSGIDPNTTLEGLILTSHSHAPQGLGTFYYIHTAFYNTKSASAARMQVAIPYNKHGSIYHRYFSSGAWSTWARYMTADEIYPVGSIVMRYDNTSPADLYGGTWVRIEGRMPFGCATSGTVGATGTHTTGSGSSSLPYVNVAMWRRTA